MKRAVLYARVSTDMQRDNYSIPTQLEESVNFVTSRGYCLVGNQLIDPTSGFPATNGNVATAIPAYVDDYTSRELSRPELDAALEYLESHGFDVLIVHALDRLARDPYIRQTLEMEFMNRGAKVEYVLGDYADTAEGEIRKDLDSTFAKWENAKRVERSTRGKRGKAEKGLFVGGRKPYGYLVDSSAVGGLAIFEREAEIVKMIFNWYAVEGLSLWKIADELTGRKIPTATGKRKWYKSSVASILRNTLYKGHIFYNKYKRIGKKLMERPQSEWIRIETTPLIEDAIFDAAQEKLHLARVNSRRKPERFYLLSGLIFCANCNRAYISHTHKPKRDGRKSEYKSYRHRLMHGHCKNQLISAKRIEPVVWAEIKNLLLDPTSLSRGYENALA